MPGSSSNQGGKIIASNPANDYHTLWIVHGTNAAIAWAILVQLRKLLIILFDVGFLYASMECTVFPLGTQLSSSADPFFIIDVLGEEKTCQDVHETGMIVLYSQELCERLQDWGL
jgi:hypothetical protein